VNGREIDRQEELSCWELSVSIEAPFYDGWISRAMLNRKQLLVSRQDVFILIVVCSNGKTQKKELRVKKTNAMAIYASFQKRHSSTCHMVASYKTSQLFLSFQFPFG
jgi:hypothetical protein